MSPNFRVGAQNPRKSHSYVTRRHKKVKSTGITSGQLWDRVWLTITRGPLGRWGRVRLPSWQVDKDGVGSGFQVGKLIIT